MTRAGDNAVGARPLAATRLGGTPTRLRARAAHMTSPATMQSEAMPRSGA